MSISPPSEGVLSSDAALIWNFACLLETDYHLRENEEIAKFAIHSKTNICQFQSNAFHIPLLKQRNMLVYRFKFVNETKICSVQMCNQKGLTLIIQKKKTKDLVGIIYAIP